MWRAVLLALLPASPATASAPASVRQQLEREYADIVAGYSRDDPGPWLRHLTPDFHLVLFSGDVKDRAWVEDYVRNNAKNFHIVSIAMKIENVRVSGARALATVRQTSLRTFKDDKGEHKLEVDARQLESWRRASGKWKLWRVREYQVLSVKQDGKPLPPPSPPKQG
jgi:hypothetical protein